MPCSYDDPPSMAAGVITQQQIEDVSWTLPVGALSTVSKVDILAIADSHRLGDTCGATHASFHLHYCSQAFHVRADRLHQGPE